MIKQDRDPFLLRADDEIAALLATGHRIYSDDLTVSIYDPDEPLPDFLDPAKQPPPVAPAIAVTRLQLRKALNATGLRAGVEKALAAGPIEHRDAWECSEEFHEDHPIAIAMTQAIGKKDVDRRALFELAATF